MCCFCCSFCDLQTMRRFCPDLEAKSRLCVFSKVVEDLEYYNFCFYIIAIQVFYESYSSCKKWQNLFLRADFVLELNDLIAQAWCDLPRAPKYHNFPVIEDLWLTVPLDVNFECFLTTKVASPSARGACVPRPTHTISEDLAQFMEAGVTCFLLSCFAEADLLCWQFFLFEYDHPWIMHMLLIFVDYKRHFIQLWFTYIPHHIRGIWSFKKYISSSHFCCKFPALFASLSCLGKNHWLQHYGSVQAYHFIWEVF